MPEPTRLTPSGGVAASHHTDRLLAASAIGAPQPQQCRPPCPLVLHLTPLTPPVWLPGWCRRSAPPGAPRQRQRVFPPALCRQSRRRSAGLISPGRAQNMPPALCAQKNRPRFLPPKTRENLRTRSSATVFSRHHRKTRRKRAVKPPWFDLYRPLEARDRATASTLPQQKGGTLGLSA